MDDERGHRPARAGAKVLGAAALLVLSFGPSALALSPSTAPTSPSTVRAAISAPAATAAAAAATTSRTAQDEQTDGAPAAQG